MELQEVTKDEWQDWKKNPVTKRCVANLVGKLELIKDGIVDGRFRGEDLLNAIGRAQSVKDCVLFIIQDFDYVGRDEDQSKEDFITNA